jgi:NACHT/LRR/PYD domain-containing protein 1
MKFQFVRINKLPPVDALYLGSRYIVSGSKKVEIIPKVSIQVFLMPGLGNLWG